MKSLVFLDDVFAQPTDYFVHLCRVYLFFHCTIRIFLIRFRRFGIQNWLGLSVTVTFTASSAAIHNRKYYKLSFSAKSIERRRCQFQICRRHTCNGRRIFFAVFSEKIKAKNGAHTRDQTRSIQKRNIVRILKYGFS